jgi:hypothetical protein
MRLRIHVQAFVLIAMVVGFAGLPGAWGAPAGDAVVDAKRRAASELMKAGKTEEAISLLGEVLKADEKNYKDHLMLGRAYDKLNKPSEAVQSYRCVLELLGPGEDRPARAEVERRLKVLDAQMLKIQAAEEELLKKLDGLEHEAIGAKDMRAVQRVFHLKGSLWAAQGRKDAASFEVIANGDWQGGTMTVQAGISYRIRVAGMWTIHPGISCTADGTDALPATQWGAAGGLIAAVEGDARYKVVGSNGVFTAPSSGRLVFVCNMSSLPQRNKNDGKIIVLAVRQ